MEIATFAIGIWLGIVFGVLGTMEAYGVSDYNLVAEIAKAL